MADQFSFDFGFDCDELQDDEDTLQTNYIPPAENELKPASTADTEEHAIHFVDARWYKEKENKSVTISSFNNASFTYGCDYDADDESKHNKPSMQTSVTATSLQAVPSFDLEDIMDDLVEITDKYEPDYNDDDDELRSIDHTPSAHISSRTPSASPIAIQSDPIQSERYLKEQHFYPRLPTYEQMPSDALIFSESEFDSELTEDDAYNFEECGIGFRTLPFDFEKPLRWKPVSTVIVDLEIQEIKFAISRTVQHAFDSDDDDSHSSDDDDDSLFLGNIKEAVSCTEDVHIPYVDDRSTDDEFVLNRMPSSEQRFLSTLNPPLYDIILFESSPLRIHGVDHIADINKVSLEYLQCSLLDQDTLYGKIWQTLLRNSFSVRCGNLNGNITNIKRISNEGGCKILQFVAHCCNPLHVGKDSIYYDLTKHIENPLDEDYILMELDDKKYIIDGEWIPCSKLKEYFEGYINDIVIIMSPQHIRMANVFLQMGSSYVIAIKTFDQNNHNTQNNFQILDFLHHFYSVILNQECLSRAFELAKTATKASHDIKSKKEMKKITKKLQKLNGIQVEDTIMSNDDEDEEVDDDRFILLTAQNTAPPQRFIVFDKLERGEPIDAIGGNLLYQKYKTNWNNIIMKPYIGRCVDVINLFNALLGHKMILIGGRENDGRKSVIKRLISYLYQHNYFEDGLFLLDCKSELMHKKRQWKFKDILCLKLSQLGFDMHKKPQSNSQLNVISDSQRKLHKNGVICAPSAAEPIQETQSVMVQPSAYYMASLSNFSLYSHSFTSVHFSQNTLVKLPHTPPMDDMMRAIEQYNICFVLFNVDCWDNDEVYHFMDEFATKNKNNHSQCIFTMQYGKHCDLDDVDVAAAEDHNLPRVSYREQLSNIPTTLQMGPATSHIVTDEQNLNFILHSPLKKGTVPMKIPGISDHFELTEGKSVVDELLCGPAPNYVVRQMSRSIVKKPRISWKVNEKEEAAADKNNNKSFLSIFREQHRDSFAVLTIHKLDREHITELFVQLCYYDFDRLCVSQHNELHDLCDGSPGKVKRAAAFYHFLCKTQDDDHAKEVGLDTIVTKLSSTHSGWMSDFHRIAPKLSSVKKRASSKVMSRLGSLRYSQKLLIEKSIAVNTKKTAAARAPPPQPQHLRFGETIAINVHKKQNYNLKRLQLTNSPLSGHSDRSPTPMIMEDSVLEDTVAMIANSKTFDDLLPILRGIPLKELKRMVTQHYDLYDNSMKYASYPSLPNNMFPMAKSVIIRDENNNISNNLKRKKMKIKLHAQIAKKNNLKKRVKKIKNKKDEFEFKVTECDKFAPLIQESITDELSSSPAISDDNDSNNLRAVIPILTQKFYDITHLNKITFTTKQMQIWSRWVTNDAIDTQLFSKWFVSMAHIVADLYDVQRTEYAQATFLDLFYNQNIVENKLKYENIGTFMFCLGNKCNQLIIIYVARNSEMNEILLTRLNSNRNSEYILGNNDDKTYNITKYIRNHKHLKLFLRTNHGAIDKLKMF